MYFSRLVESRIKKGVIVSLSKELIDSSTPWQPGNHFVVGTPENRYSLFEKTTAIGVTDLDLAIPAATGDFP